MHDPDHGRFLKGGMNGIDDFLLINGVVPSPMLARLVNDFRSCIRLTFSVARLVGVRRGLVFVVTFLCRRTICGSAVLGALFAPTRSILRPSRCLDFTCETWEKSLLVSEFNSKISRLQP